MALRLQMKLGVVAEEDRLSDSPDTVVVVEPSVGARARTKGHLYVVDANFETVQVFNDQGALLMDFGQEGQQPGAFWLPAGIFIDRRNRIWVADSYNRRVQVFDFLPEDRP